MLILEMFMALISQSSYYTLEEIAISIFILVVALPAVPAVIAYLVFKSIGLTGFRRLFSYEPKESFMHHMHPLTKLFIILFIAIGTALAMSPYTLITLLLLTVPLWYLSKPSEGRVRLMLILLFTQWLLVAWGQSFLNPYYTRGTGLHQLYIFPRPLWWFAYSVTIEGFMYGLVQGIRVVTALSAAILLITTTHPSEIIYGLKSFRLPVEINFMIAVTFRSIPLLLEKSFLVLNAERARGLRLRPRTTSNVFQAIKEVGRTMKTLMLAFFPIIIESIRAARQLAIAASVRAFRAYKERTYYKHIPMTKTDMFISILALIGIITMLLIPFFPTIFGTQIL